VQARTTEINLARMAPAQLVVFIAKQAGECVTPATSEERISLARKCLQLVVCALVVIGQSILLRQWTLRPKYALKPVQWWTLSTIK